MLNHTRLLQRASQLSELDDQRVYDAVSYVGAEATKAEGVVESPSQSPGLDGPRPGHEQTLEIATLQYMDVFIGDSGAEVPLKHHRVLGETHIPNVGNIFIQSIIGRAVEAKLVALDITQYVADQNLLAAIGQAPPLHVTFAITERLNEHELAALCEPTMR